MTISVSVFEKLRFDSQATPPSRHKFLHSGDRFRKAPFSVIEHTVLCWAVGQTGEKKNVFKFIRISMGKVKIFVCDHSNESYLATDSFGWYCVFLKIFT